MGDNALVADGGIDSSMVRLLVDKFNVDENTIRELYLQELANLKPKSRIASFLPIICERRVKEIIIKRYSAKQS